MQAVCAGGHICWLCRGELASKGSRMRMHGRKGEGGEREGEGGRNKFWVQYWKCRMTGQLHTETQACDYSDYCYGYFYCYG